MRGFPCLLVCALSCLCSFALSMRPYADSTVQDRCFALVLAGGGDHGAYEAGVIDAIAHLTTTPWNVVAGTSAGSLNAGLVGQFKIGQEPDAAEYAKLFWSELTREQIYNEWEGGLIEGLLFKSGLFDNEVAIKHLMPKWMDVSKLLESGRYIEIGATNLDTRKYVPFDVHTPYLHKAVTASWSIPGFFPAVDIAGENYVDGGVTQNCPISTALAKCKSLGYNDTMMTVDVVLADGEMLNTPDILVTPLVLMRSFGIILTDFLSSDLEAAMKDFPDAKFRIFRPKKTLPGIFILFDHDEMTEMMQLGYTEAKRVLHKTEGW